MERAEKLMSGVPAAPIPLAFHVGDGVARIVGEGSPDFAIRIKTPEGRRAMTSLDELAISEAYMRDDLDFEGDLIGALGVARTLLSDQQLWIKTWRWLEPLLVGRPRCNPEWIAKHYDAGNLQLLTVDRDYHTYTPGLFNGDDDTIEASARRKLEFAFESLRLRPGDRVLDVGCGWGGFVRYCAGRGATVTGITLSRDQLAHNQRLFAQEGIAGTLLYQDFFTYEPDRPFDAVSVMGVMEDLRDYQLVMDRLHRLVRPGGRVYFDFSAGHLAEDTSSFITKYIWPGRFRAVYMPELFTALARSPFEVVELWNDRHNYYLWAVKVHERWFEKKDEVVRLAGEELWRMWRLLFAGVASVMSPSTHVCTAYRLLIELPERPR